MSLRLIVTPLAEITFEEEKEFIFRKWNEQEVQKFITLSENHIKRLRSGLIEGMKTSNPKIHIWVISKQTSLLYAVDESSKTLKIILFWNNQKDPNTLIGILKKLKP